MGVTSPIETHLRAAERRLIDSFALRPRELSPELSERSGRWKDAPVTLSTQVYEGDAIGYLRVALISGVQLILGSLLVMPRANRPVPILSADLSWSGARREMTMVADLVPVRDALERDEELATIARVAPDATHLPVTGAPPSWHSPSAIHTRVGPALEAGALQALDGYVTGFIGLLGGATPSAERAFQVRAMHGGYALARRTEDDQLGILGKMFGQSWAEEYSRKVLFPSLH